MFTHLHFPPLLHYARNMKYVRLSIVLLYIVCMFFFPHYQTGVFAAVTSQQIADNPPPPPCTGLTGGKCNSVDTGIGNISTNPAGLVGSIFGILLSLSGSLAILLIVYGGYRMMSSQGNPEKVQAARETIVSAIVGLLFTIFSLVILEIIGVDILHIPGFKH